jgi:phosphoenolpyruvate-protein phosphotransferase/dihydroxyacetone kinase phosphotransfer subunit
VIGIVVVSHSRALAEAAVRLADEMVKEAARPRIEVAAGLDATTFGTDAAAVSEALERADSPDGVLLLVDLGSAILSAEMALEFVDPQLAARVTISSAPLVEGLVAAVVGAATGASLSAVAAEAQRGLLAKQDHLGDAVTTSEASTGDTSATEDAVAEIDVINAHGLHARPAAQLVGLAASYDARVTLAHLGSGRGPVDASSLSLVATLNARRGDRLRVSASGPDAAAAVSAIVEFAARGFDDLAEQQVAATTVTGRDEARPGGSGLDLAIGPAVVAQVEVETSRYQAGDVDYEQANSTAAQKQAVDSLAATAKSAGGAEAGILAAQAALITDPDVQGQVRDLLTNGSSAPAAWSHVLSRLAERFESLDDDYQRERAQDVRSVERRILRALTGAEPDVAAPQSDTPQILVTPELDAATAATLDTSDVAGVVTTQGGATGHGVIVARSRGIPILTGVAEAGAVVSGELVAFDSRAPEFIVDPDAETRARYEALVASREAQRQAALAAAFEPAVTKDGTTIAVLANVASAAEAAVAAAMGAEGAGLVRTEVLFGASRSAPTVDEQLEAFLAIGAALGGQPITVRTWDVGGDKPLPYLPQPHEANPFLGERGLRLSRRDPSTLHDQLVAVCRAARETAVKVMFPMVTTVAEVEWALDELDRAATAAGGRPDGLQVGIMIEVPAAALRVSWLADRLDFVSIGTNDLTQYTLAAERGNGAVAALADSVDPAVLHLIAKVAAEVPDRVDVAVCGDLASQLAAIELLVGCGVDELSVVAPAVPGVKERVRGLSRTDAAKVALRAVTLGSADDVRALLAHP